MISLIKKYRNWRERRYWKSRQFENLKIMIQSDARWMAHDKNISSVLARYESALSDDWYKVSYEDSDKIRTRLGLEPKYIKQP